jgi:hypothetical protein
MRFASILAGTIAVFLTTSVAEAAKVASVEGKAQVSQGSGFSPLVSGATVNVGDKITVAAGGSVVIILDNGCPAMVKPGTVFAVPAAKSCSAAVPPQPDPGPVLPPLVGPAVIGGIAAAIIFSIDDNDGPVSP